MFPEPEALLTEAPILLGIDNRKMSKSYGNAIELGADPDTIRDMVGRMITDPQKIRRGDPGPPRDLQRVLLREAVRHAGRADRRDRPHLPHRASSAAATTRTRSPSGSWSTCARSASAASRRWRTAASSSGSSTAGAERAREIAVPNMERAKEAMGL